MGRVAPASSGLEFPSVSMALDDFAKSRMEDGDTGSLNDPQLARLIYAIGMLSRLPADVIDEHLFVSDEQLASVLALASPSDTASSERGHRLLALLRQEFTDRRHWADVMATARTENLVNSQIAAFGPPCAGSVKRRGPNYCALITTDFVVDELSIDAIKAIIDPLNWADTGSDSFFCRMTELQPNTDANGWSRVLEEGSTDCSQYRIKTALKYWKAEFDGGLIINYDVDDERERTDDNGMVVVDSGYLWVTAAGGGGVRIRTSKEFLIHGVGPTASAVFACVLGWADVTRHWFTESVQNVQLDRVGWSVSSAPERASVRQRNLRQRPPAVPAGVRRQLIAQSIEFLAQCADAVVGRRP